MGYGNCYRVMQIPYKLFLDAFVSEISEHCFTEWDIYSS